MTMEVGAAEGGLCFFLVIIFLCRDYFFLEQL